jgi:hypothetical protein
MRVVRGLAALLLVGMFVAPGVAPAAGDTGPRIGLFVHGGYSTYVMADVNDSIAVVNDSIRVAGLSMDEIKGGLNFGGGIRVMLNRSLSVSAGYERLSGATSFSFAGASAKFKVPANAITATAEYFLPMSGPVAIGFGAGGGYYISAAGFEADFLSMKIRQDWKGNAVGFHGLLLCRIPATSSIQVDGAVGYRRAIAKDVEVAGTKTTCDLDWSGLMTRVGLTFYLTPVR